VCRLGSVEFIYTCVSRADTLSASSKTRITTRAWQVAGAIFILVRQSLRALVVWSSVFTLVTATDVAKGGPFRDFFRALHSAITHPNEKPRSHQRSHRHNETPQSDAPSSETAASPVSAPPGEGNIRLAKEASGTKHGKTNLPYGTPVPGQSGLVTSPFAPDSGYVDVSGFPHGTKVKDPYTGQVFLTP
jgi:hypothetical protein